MTVSLDLGLGQVPVIPSMYCILQSKPFKINHTKSERAVASVRVKRCTLLLVYDTNLCKYY